MKKLVVVFLLLALVGVFWSSESQAQGDLGTLNVRNGGFELRTAPEGNYASTSGIVPLVEGNAIRWDASAAGEINFFNGLDIPVLSGTETLSEIEIMALQDGIDASNIALAQRSGDVLYTLPAAEASEVSIEDGVGGASVSFTSGAVQVNHDSNIDGVRSNLTWDLYSEGSVKVGSVFIDLGAAPPCETAHSPQLDVYNAGSATAPTYVGLSGNMQFSTLNESGTTEVLLAGNLLIITGQATLSLCGPQDQLMQLNVMDASEEMRFVVAESRDPIINVPNGRTVTFVPGSTNPLQTGGRPSGIATGSGVSVPQQSSDCDGDTILSDGLATIDRTSNNCLADTNQDNQDWVALNIGESSDADVLLYQSDETSSLEVFGQGDFPDSSTARATDGAQDVLVQATSSAERRDISRGGLNTVNVGATRAPDFRWVAYATNRDGNYEIYVSNIEGDFSQRATINASSMDLDPVWSPTGELIAYESNVTGNWEIRVLDVVTGRSRQVTDSPANDVDVSFAPDGQRFVFTSDRPFVDESGLTIVGRWQIYELDIESGDLTRLSDGTANDYNPAFNVAGDTLLFRSDRADDTDSAMFVMDMATEELERISIPNAQARNYVWSPEDRLVAYQAELNDGTPSDIYVYELDTGINYQVTDSAGSLRANIDSEPMWLGLDESMVIFASNAPGRFDIYSLPSTPAEPLNVLEAGINLTDTADANERNPESNPNDEDGSRNGALPPAYQG